MTNPCCCCALRDGVFVIAIFEMVSCILSLGMRGYNIGMSNAVKDKEETKIGTALHICVDLAHFAIAIVLFIGVRKNERSKCRIWFVVNIILRVLGFCLAVFSLIAFDAALAKTTRERQNEDAALNKMLVFGAAIVVFVFLLLEVYLLFVVHCFIQELDAGLYMVGGGGLVGGGGAGYYPASQQPSYYQPAYNAPNYSQADFYKQQQMQNQPPQYNPNQQFQQQQPQQVQQQQFQQQPVQYGQN